jgi:Saxitoxin biosynthesis operon protein SxtJ
LRADQSYANQPPSEAGEQAMRRADHHEFGARAESIETSSDRSFGLVFAAVFALLAAYNAWNSGAAWPLFLAIAVGFLAVALVRPKWLALLNRLWTRFGLILGMIVSPIVLALMFFLVVTPVGLLMRLTGKDPLRLRPDSGTGSYWIVRHPPGPPGDSMSEQF